MNGTQLPLRPYQRQAIEEVSAHHTRGVNRPAVVIPTGGGKTVTFAHMAASNPRRTLVLAHREELIEQAHAKLTAVAPRLRPGIEMASRTAGDAQAVVGSVQSMCTERRLAAWASDAFGLVVVDECHHAASETYDRVMRHLGCYDGTPTVGFTATLARGDGVGLGHVWQAVVEPTSILQMIEDGYLVEPRGIRVPLDFDISRASVSGGDYTAGSLGQVMEDAGFEQAVAKAWLEHAEGRATLVFTPTIATAKAAAQALREVGCRAEAVWGEMDKDARRAAVQGLRDGTLDALTNCNVLTEGTDIPRAAVAIMARPTRSRVLYQQMAGRVLRKDPEDPGKVEALILDLVGVTADHRLRTLVDLAAGQLPAKARAERPEAEDGETLTEAVARVSGVRLGAAHAVDLFRASDSVWLSTEGGHWFVPAGEGQVFLREWPTRNGWSVGWMPRTGEPVPLGRATVLARARALGEEHAARADRAAGRRPSTTGRDAAWRGREPSPNQLGTAAKMRVEVPPGATAGEVSDLISARVAGKIDRYFARRGA